MSLILYSSTFLMLLVFAAVVMLCCLGCCLLCIRAAGDNDDDLNEQPQQYISSTNERALVRVVQHATREMKIRDISLTLPTKIYCSEKIDEELGTSSSSSTKDDEERQCCESSGDHNGQESTATTTNVVQQPQCAICLDDFGDGDAVCTSDNPSCRHTFHVACITDWLLKSDECPCCRRTYLTERCKLKDDSKPKYRTSHRPHHSWTLDGVPFGLSVMGPTTDGDY